ncbi:hypothetical protein [Kutzneria sp. CA-103260]|uniref:hypothetical protein n=1 Tax=Kutzneria sp. CA-103260 TaxID=2802641 RepID=UPI001BA66302|nr:hypothetical protein [Kutzneria sp. CA-103260]QUQ68331.1 hypothetical protein JJ691_60760 [Kutzneria sp. CA-103260]
MSGRLMVEDPAQCADNRPSFYADPVAWLVARAVEQTLTEPVERDQVAVLVMSATTTRPTMAGIADKAARGRVSPLRFAGANPGILAGLTCIQQGFTGPSLVLANEPADALDTAAAVVDSWLDSGQARHVVCVAHRADPNGHQARAVVVGGHDDRADRLAQLL